MFLQVTMQIYHGTRPIVDPLNTDFIVKTDASETDFYDIVKYATW